MNSNVHCHEGHKMKKGKKQYDSKADGAGLPV